MIDFFREASVGCVPRTFITTSYDSPKAFSSGLFHIMLFGYTAHGHNLNFHVGWVKSLSCPPTLFKKVQFVPVQSINEKETGKKEYFI
jgi:hypothetical protein